MFNVSIVMRKQSVWTTVWRQVLSGVALAGGIFCTPVQAATACPEAVRIAVIDFAFPPYTFGSGSEFANPPGKHVEWVNAAIEASRCKPRVELVRLPIARMRMELGAGLLDFLVAGSDSPEIRSIATMPMRGEKPDTRMRLQTVEYSLYVRRGESDIHWDGTELSGPPDFKVGVSPLVAARGFAHEKGWKTEIGLTPAGALKMLVLGRMPVVLTSDTAFMSLPEAERAQIQKLEPPALVTEYFPVAGKIFYAKHPDFVEQFWRGLCKASRADQTGAPPCPK